MTPGGLYADIYLTAATVLDDGMKHTLSGKKRRFIISATYQVKDLDPKLPEVKTII